MPPLSMMIKPSSSNCNLRCKYCFYFSEAEKRQIPSYGFMSVDTLEVLVKKALEYADNVCTFAFQGGEPTLVGLDFYKKLIEFEKKYNIKNVTINNCIQTNGISIDKEWAQFLADNNFLVGVSLDGPKQINDLGRVYPDNKGSFTSIMKAIDLLEKYKVEYNILIVVTSHAARHPNKVYNFYKKHGFKYIQFIPCIDPFGEEPGSMEYSCSSERFGYFLRKMFDNWYTDVKKGEFISIRFFDNLVGMAMGYKPEACGMIGHCQCEYIIEANGGVYPCDFYVIDKWYMGNIVENSIDELSNSKVAKEFVEVSKYVDPKCRKCRWYSLCRGGCRRYREPFVDGKPSLSYYCQGYEQFFEYAWERLQELARIFSQRRY